jgi:hypothetical protein
MSSFVSSLKRARATAEAETSAEPHSEHPFFKYISPLYSPEEEAVLQRLRAEAESYGRYARAEWMIELLNQEKDISAKALEGCTDPYEATIEHWQVAIDAGKLLKERVQLHKHAMSLAYSLTEYGLMRMSSAHHYIGCAMNPSQSYRQNIFRLNEVINEFKLALAEARPVCMCKEKPCCCV